MGLGSSWKSVYKNVFERIFLMTIKIKDLPTLDPSEYDPTSDLILVQKDGGGTYCTTSESLIRFQRSQQSNLINFFDSPVHVDNLVDSYTGTTKTYKMNSYRIPNSASSVLFHFTETAASGAVFEVFRFFYDGYDAENDFLRRWYSANRKKNNGSARYSDQLWIPINDRRVIPLHFIEIRNSNIKAEIVAYS